MKKLFLKLIAYFDKLKFSYKTSFLIFIITGGMICIIILSQVSIFILKSDFDTLFDKRTKSLIELEYIKDSYKTNIQETLNDFERHELNYTQASEVLQIAQEIIEKNWILYKRNSKIEERFFIINFIKKFILKSSNYYENRVLREDIIENINLKKQKINNLLEDFYKSKNNQILRDLNFEINSISVYLASLVNYDLSLAINEKRDTDKIFNTIIFLSFVSIFFVFFFSILLSIFIITHFRKLHSLLEKKVEEKTKELKELNTNLELKITQEVAKNRKKDIIMFQQARFASLGEMLNNIAHQWRQPLGSLTMIIQSFQTKMQLNKLTQEFVDEKTKDALLLSKNMSNTLDDFRNFFLPNKKRSEFYIKDCIEHALELSKYILLNDKISTELKIKKNLKINSFYNELSHVFLNIISNAKDVLVNNVDDKSRFIKIIVDSHKNFLIVNIIDNGGGVEKEILEKIFEPYYTTKYKSAGTGIGLYMSKEIIQRHLKGQISCKNLEHTKDGKNYIGASFTIKIPLKEENE